MVPELSSPLRPIYELELELGNSISRIDRPAGTKCPLAVIFRKPLHKKEIAESLVLSELVEYWEKKDPHYPMETGYLCRRSRHVIAGPVTAK